jgi:hypothetical protein
MPPFRRELTKAPITPQKIVNTFDVGRALELGEAYPRGVSLK